MLVNLTDMLAQASSSGGAVACINTPGEDIIRAVVGAAEDLDVPVIIAHAEDHDGAVPIEQIGPAMIAAATQASVPVCVHLDHAYSKDFVQRGIDQGFTSIMYDCSALPYAENVRRLRALVEEAHPLGLTVEGEIGVMPSSLKGPAPGKAYTTPAEAAKFADQTNVDALAVCFGTVHGVYADSPSLDLAQLSRIREAVRPQTALVMHGSSGLDDSQLSGAVASGITKVNYYTYLAVEASDQAAAIVNDSSSPVRFHDLTVAVTKIMRQHARQVISLLRNPQEQ
ncbi:MAG: class II fructose-bisphosphate aldolase [Micrococcales bacterium]|nr:class II fructose-bisphosphate aldolase [Micrococcales bacterium]